MKVDFLIAGTQKGGTTALATFLSEHPKICVAKKKEIHFFDRDEFFNDSLPNYDEYHRHFPDVGNRKRIGEATPIYMYWKPAPKRIKEYNPNIKLILILRNPIERAYSHYIMEKRRKAEKFPFSMAIRLEKLRCASAFPKQHRVYSYIDRGFYSKQIKNMLKYFSSEQILFLRTEDLRQKHDITINRICDFLCIERLNHTKSEIIFSNEYEEMRLIDKKFLQNKFHNEINKLEVLLGWNCSDWKRLF